MGTMKKYSKGRKTVSSDDSNWRGRKALTSIQHVVMVVAVAWIWKSCEAFNLDDQYPIIFEDPTVNPGRATYFGYSVILHSSQSRNSDIWIQVGAPRANSSFKEHRSIYEPGVTYRCPLAPPGPCKPLRLDGKGNDPSSGHGERYWDLKDSAWIGASIGVQPGPQGVVVVCGPRWRNQYFHRNNETHPLGVCYWMPASEEEVTDTGVTVHNAEKMIPLLNTGRLKFTMPKWRGSYVYDFGMGEAGMSLYLSSEKGRSEMILGAPGMLNWRGGIIVYRDVAFNEGGRSRRFAQIGAFSQLTISSPHSLLRYKEFGYIGYQVSSGRFFKPNETIYVATAPRGGDLQGNLFLFTFNKFGSQKESDLIMVGRAKGFQIGEYFGASLAVGDLNDDGLDDIVVGAPLYANKDTGETSFDEGRVSVYLGSKENKLHETLWIIGGIPGARFGSAISYLGDIDFDGYAEVAIGAPHEDDGRGAVYIYPGDKITGLSKKPVQTLKAHDIYPYLRGFGHSISALRADIDQNGCPDIAIGSYQSGHAVVLRGRPVMRWEIIPPHSIPSIPRNASVLTVDDVCVVYTGEYAPKTIGVWRMLEMDPILKRCNMGEKLLFSELIHLTKNKPYCEKKEITLKPKIEDFITPMEVNIWYLLPEEKEMLELKDIKGSSEFKVNPIIIGRNKEGSDDFCKDCPITQGVSRISLTIPFEVECGMDNVCYSDLQVNGNISPLKESLGEGKKSYVIGYSDLTLKLMVSNKKSSELAYLTRLYIEIGEPAKISQFNSLCRETSQLPSFNQIFNFTESFQNPASNSTGVLPESYRKRNEGTYVTCDLDNPLEVDIESEVLLGLDMSNAKGSKGMLVRAWVTTSSVETNPADNFWELYVPFHSEADVNIIGATDNEIYTYYKGNKESEEDINFINIYEVEKTGPSPLEVVELEFHIPREIRNSEGKKLASFLSIVKLEAKQDEQSLQCKLLKKNAFTYSEREGNQEIIDNLTKYANGNQSISMMENSTLSAKVLKNNTLFINCSVSQIKKDHYVACTTIRCEAGPLSTSTANPIVYLHLKLNAKALNRVMSSSRAISIGTTGFVKIKDPPDIKQSYHGKQVFIPTLFIELLSTKPIDSWVIAISIAVGLLLLLFIQHGMSKAGFFKRKNNVHKDALHQQLLADEVEANQKVDH